MKKQLIITLICVIVLLFGSSLPSAQAQSNLCFVVTFGGNVPPGCYEWDQYNHTIPDFPELGACTGTYGALSGGNLVGSGPVSCGGVSSDMARVTITVPAGCNIVYFNAPYKFGGSVGSWGRLFSYTTPDTYIVTNNGPQGGETSFEDWILGEASFNDTATKLSVSFEANAGLGSTPVVDYVRFDCEAGSTEPPEGGTYGGPFQPIAEEQQIFADVPRSGGGDVTGWSTITATTQDSIIPNTVPVYSPVAGTVGFVSPVPPYRVEILAEVDGEEWTIEYFNLQNVYVQSGDEVSANCIIGYAGNIFDDIGSDEPDQKQIRYLITNATTSSFEDWELHTNPSGTSICGSLNQSENCLSTNPNFVNNAAGWTLNRGLDGKYALALNDQVTLQGISSVSQYVPLEESTEYYVTVGVALLQKPSGVFIVSVGNEEIEEQIYADEIGEPSVFGVRVGEFQTILVGPFTTTTADLLPNLYNVNIKNGFLHSDLALSYACVHELSTSPVDNHGACFFPNIDEFTTNGDRLIDPLGTPYVRLYDAEYLAAEITLSGYTSEDATYNVDVSTRAYSYDSNDDPATPTNLILSFDDGTEYADIASHELQPGIWSKVQYTIVIPAGDEVTADLTVTHDQDDLTDSEVVDVAVVCLWPKEGYYPGFEPPANDVGSDGCSPVLAPESFSITNLGAWLSWLWDSIKAFFTCMIPREIGRVVAAVTGVMLWLKSLGLWLGALVQVLAQWFFNLIDYLIALFTIVFNSIIATVWDAVISIPIIQWIYDNITLGQIAFAALLAIATMYVEALQLGAQVISTLTEVLRLMWIGASGAFTSTTETDLGLPNCATVGTNDLFYSFCASFELVDYTASSFPSFAGFYIVLAAGTALYTLRETLEIFGDAFGKGEG